jgi:hypothetical protein
MNTVDIAIVALAEDHAIEGSVKDDPDSHHILLTLNLEILNLGHVGRLGYLPGITTAWARCHTKVS